MTHKTKEFTVILATFLGENGRYEESLSLWLKALSYNTEDFDIIFNTAAALRQVGRNREAEDYYIKSARLSPQVSQENVL